MLPALYAIVDVSACASRGLSPATCAAGFLEGGARLLQLRAKPMASGAMLALARDLVRMAAGPGARVLVNDRADVALMARASGVHVGQEDLPPEAVRRLLGTAAIVGWSTHTPDQLEAAADLPIDYVAVGPVFPTATKDTGYAAVGLELVRRAVAAARGRPVVAIGGITLETAPAVIEAGAASVAVISDLLATGDPAGRVRAYLAALASKPSRSRV
jgi:thiamine-phosphate pyrophosphorylase